MTKLCELCDRYPQQGGHDRPHLCVRCAAEAKPPELPRDDRTEEMFPGWQHVHEKGQR